MKNYIEKRKSMCIAIINYAEKRKGVLDPKALADVKACLARLEEFGSQQHTSREAKTAARLEVKKTTENLKKVIMRSRRLLEAFAVDNPKGPGIPKATKNSFFPSRIQAFAIAHKEDLEALPADPIIAKTLAALGTATSDFAKAFGAARTGGRDLATLNATVDEELSAISGRLFGYRTLAAFSVSRTDRRDLIKLIRSNVPATAQHGKAGSAVTDDATQTVTTAQPPALPAVPATAVPPSSEHPIMSANA